MVAGARTTLRSTLPLPSLLGNAEILLSNLFAQPLLTARGFPNPNSSLYSGKLGKLPIVIDAPSKFPSGNSLGCLSQSSTPRLTVASSCVITFQWSKFALRLAGRLRGR